MTPTPPSTTSSSAGGHSPDTQFRVVRKRNRVPLSCGPCRHRKLKCNRSNPCENCVKRGDAASCSYAAPGTRRKNQNQGPTSPDDMQNRIDRLEGLVLSLMTNGQQAPGAAAAQAAISRSGSLDLTPPSQDDDDGDDRIPEEDEGESDVEAMTNSLGILKVDNEKHKSFYIGDSHWHSVLKDITEVKNYFIQHKNDLDSHYKKVKEAMPQTAIDGPAFLFSNQSNVSEEEIRAALPSRSAVEKLVTRYFNSYDPAVHILHSPTFHKELYDHWQRPSKTSLIWLGLLYAILCLAMQSYHKIGDEPPEWKDKTLELAAAYRLRTVQCLIVSDYTKSVDHTIETMLLYIHGEYSSRWDAEVGIWLIVGLIVRLAMRMGYHRDPKHYAGITPYRGEMRRRIWAFIRQSDVMFSFQLALPSMTRTCDSDTEFPRNIFEDEFGPDSTELPPARPITEPTPVSYMIAKARIAYEFGCILEHVNAVSGPQISYEDILARDARLKEVHRSLPPHLKLRPIEKCTHDPATLLMQRYSLDILYNKTVCVLHRKYFSRARQNSRYNHSRRACIESAMEIMRHQSALFRESQVGGRMRTMKWVISSLTKHDFLLASMVISLDLHYDTMASRKVGGAAGNKVMLSSAQRAEMTASLETSLSIWKESSEVSIEAYKASHILGIMLQTIKRNAAEATDVDMVKELSFDDTVPEHSAAMTLGMLSGGLSPQSSSVFSSLSGPSPIGSGAFEMTMGDDSMRSRTGLTPDPSMPGGTGLTPGGLGSGRGLTPGPFADQPVNFNSPMSMFGTSNVMGDVSMNLDWDAWDSFIQNPNAMDPNNSFQMFPSTFDPSQLNPEAPQEPTTNFSQGSFSALPPD